MQPHAETEKDRAAELAPEIQPNAAWRVASVGALPDFRLRVTFNDGTEGIVEMAAFLQSPNAGVFSVLCDESLFLQVKVELGAVTWPGDLDLAPDAMHREITVHGKWIVR